MNPTETALGVVLLPAILSGVFLLLATYFSKWKEALLVSLSLPVAASMGFYWVLGWPALPPQTAQEWLFYLPLLSILCVWCELIIPYRWLKRSLFFFLILGASYGVLKPLITYEWEWSHSLLWLLVLSSLASALWIALDIIANRTGGRLFTLSGLMAFSALSVFNVLSGSASMAFLLAAISAGWGAAFVLYLVRKQYLGVKALVPFTVLSLLGALLNSYYFVDVHLGALLLSLAPYVVFYGLKQLRN